MPVIDKTRQISAADAISCHLLMNMKAVMRNRYNSEKFQRPALYLIEGQFFASPPDNNPPQIEDWEWGEAGMYSGRKVYKRI